MAKEFFKAKSQARLCIDIGGFIANTQNIVPKRIKFLEPISSGEFDAFLKYKIEE